MSNRISRMRHKTYINLPALTPSITSAQTLISYRPCNERQPGSSISFHSRLSKLSATPAAVNTLGNYAHDVKIQPSHTISLCDIAPISQPFNLMSPMRVPICVFVCQSPRESEGVWFYRRWFVCQNK